MGFGGVSFWELLIVLVIVLLLFGNRIRTLGSDLGMAVKGFRSAMNEDEPEQEKGKPLPAERTDGTGDKAKDKS